jgi:transcriptional regulator
MLEVDENYLDRNLAFEILSDERSLLGFFAMTEKEGDRYLDHLWIDPAHIHSGVGRSACHFIFELANEKGWKRIFVYPDPPAMGFYERLGFENTKISVASRVAAGPPFFLYRKSFESPQTVQRMYSPPFFHEKRNEPITDLIEKNALAVLLGGESSAQSSHLPLILHQSQSGENELLGHMAKNNPHWKSLMKTGDCTAIFQGPHAYISPAWYTPKPANVPTWNYAVVHAHGSFEVIGDREAAFSSMKKQVQRFESQYRTGWKLPEESSSIAGLMDHIVVFKLTNLVFDAKFKLSQQQNQIDRINVIQELKARDREELAQYMEGDFNRVVSPNSSMDKL